MKHKKRELDSVTPNLTLSPEDIADIKRVVTDKEYAKEFFRQYDSERDEELEETKQTILTGKLSDGTVLPKDVLLKLKKQYESRTGEDLDENDKSWSNWFFNRMLITKIEKNINHSNHCRLLILQINFHH